MRSIQEMISLPFCLMAFFCVSAHNHFNPSREFFNLKLFASSRVCVCLYLDGWLELCALASICPIDCMCFWCSHTMNVFQWFIEREPWWFLFVVSVNLVGYHGIKTASEHNFQLISCQCYKIRLIDTFYTGQNYEYSHIWHFTSPFSMVWSSKWARTIYR